MVKFAWLLPLLLCLAFPAAAQVRVIDGDTLELNGDIIRIDGIDAPETGQMCKSFGGAWQCGAAATAMLETLIANRDVDCTAKSIDGYGRIISSCASGGKDIGAAMVETGHAWAFRKYSTLYVPQEERARAQGSGVWQAATETAWDFRARKWTDAMADAPEGCPIKGNISQHGHIYHAPWSRWYNRTRINTSKGERWFCSEGEALAAGWRAPRR